jgi:type IV pilus assembly protein PilW
MSAATEATASRALPPPALHGSTPSPARRGSTLVDVLVGLAVALVTVVVVYQAFVVLQAIRANAAASADMQASGELALLAVATPIANAGAGIALAARWLDGCSASTDIATTLRPVGVLIVDGGRAERPDTLFIRQSLAPFAAPVAFADAAPAGADFRLQGHASGFAPGDRVVAASRTGICATTDLTGVASTTPGIVDVAHEPVALDFPATSLLLNLGPAIRASTSRYDVASGALRSTDIGNGDAPNPLVSNVVNLKLQYGIDVDGDGALDTWTSADTGTAFSPASVLAAPWSVLQRIQAVRVGIVVRSERLERSLTAAQQWVLFDCGLDDKTACPGRLTGTIVGSSSGGYRYRTFERIVPLRNALWNR